MPPNSSHRVALIVDEGSNPFEFGVATELFGLRRPELDRPWYDLVVCSPSPEPAAHRGWFRFAGTQPLAAAAHADTVIVPNRPDPLAGASPPVLHAVRSAAARGARLVSFCTGAATLAEAGVLDGRRATTHWRWADEFAHRFPRVRWDPDVLFVDEGDVLTAAGSAAALDLGLHLVRRDHGVGVAAAVARRLVHVGQRDGGQRQFVERPVAPVRDTSLAALLDRVGDSVDTIAGVADLAAHLAVSPATLHRRFRAELGTTPLAWITGARVERACRLIEQGERRLDVVARRVGYRSASTLRTQLRRRTGLAPAAYRDRFGPS